MNETVKDAAQRAVGDKAEAFEKELKAVKNDIAHLAQQISDAVNALSAVAQNQTRRGLKQARSNVEFGGVGGVGSRRRDGERGAGGGVLHRRDARGRYPGAAARDRRPGAGAGLSCRRDLAAVMAPLAFAL